MMDYMKIELETVINFLKKNDLDWNGEIISGTHLNKSILASSEDFNGKDLKVCLNNATLFLNVSPTKFSIKSLTNHMDGNLVVLQNYSDKWQQYLV